MRIDGPAYGKEGRESGLGRYRLCVTCERLQVYFTATVTDLASVNYNVRRD